jgi:ubiquinone/menaquinone biosynthesis C-methylase UbiE
MEEHTPELSPEEPGIILDLGAGDASFASQVAADEHRQATVIGVDPSFLFRGPEPDKNFPVTPSVAAFGQELPFPNESVDGIVSKVVFCHLSRKDAAAIVQEGLRILKIGGTFEINPCEFPLIPSFRKREALAYTPTRIHDTLHITKPADYADWSLKKQQQLGYDVARQVSPSVGIHWIRRAMWRALFAERVNKYPK